MTTTYHTPQLNRKNTNVNSLRTTSASMYTSTRSLTPETRRKFVSPFSGCKARVQKPKPEASAFSKGNTTPHALPARSPFFSKSRKSNFSSPGDRFIPSRTNNEKGVAHFKLTNTPTQGDVDVNDMQYKQKLADSLFDESTEGSVLRYHKKLPKSCNVNDELRNFYSSCSPKKKIKQRTIPSTPYKILDAPGLNDDYYLNLLDWGKNNTIAVALGGSVYLWNAETAEVNQLCKVSSSVTSVSWNSNNSVAVGTANAEVFIWDAKTLTQTHAVRGHSARVSSLAWNGATSLSTGGRDSLILNHDLRSNELISTYRNHTQEVVGLTWSQDGMQLASGGNDNMLNIWNTRSDEAQFTFRHHTAAVKALAWCPFKANLLASGGGAADRSIRFWNTSTGVCVDSVDTGSQVCSLKWSSYYKELISSHGYTENQLTVWKYPSMERVTDLLGHESRVLFMAMSPDGKTIASAAGSGDETIRFWKAFDIPKELSSPSFSKGLLKSMTIR